MAVQDLTPQLRTRMGRVERAVGVFVTLAAILLFAGFSYYLYSTGQRKGWFLTKVKYFTFVDSGAGLNVGDPVKLMGFNAGEITQIIPQPPGSYYKIFVAFNMRDPYFGYVWNDSQAKITAGDFLGKRYIEVSEGGASGRTTNLVASYDYEAKAKRINGVWDDKEGKYLPYTAASKGYYVTPRESPALMERLEVLAAQIEKALPDFLHLTNQLTMVLNNSVRLTSNATEMIQSVTPLVSNANIIVTHLKDPKGSLGEWLIPTNLNVQIEKTLLAANQTLGSANQTMTNADGTLTKVATGLDETLQNLANLTSNLNAQVQANTNILSNLSTTITHSDEMIQGLKKHWLLRSAFKTNKPPKLPEPKPPKK